LSQTELVLAKWGGSLITDKTREATPRPEMIQRLAREVRAALDARPGLRLVLGHGSGSFGHVVAQRYHVQRGTSEWRGYAETGAVAARLNRLVTDALLEAGVWAVSLQPSASARTRAGELLELSTWPVETLLAHGLVPLVYGDVALDDVWGSTIISTEAQFVYLARRLRPQRILLVGEVAGVYTADPLRDASARRIPVIQASQAQALDGMLHGSHGVDVTGGMRSKVQSMLALLHELPELRVALLSGEQPGTLQRALTEPEWNPGTLLVA
jgi:isopentenyl phosphate kinase